MDQRSRYEKQIDEIVNQISSCVNFTLNESGFLDKLDSENRSVVEEMALYGIKSYVDLVVSSILFPLT